MPSRKPKPKGRAGRPNLSHSTVAQIVVALVMGEGSCATIAKRHQVSERVVASIKAELPEDFCREYADASQVIAGLLKAYLTEAVTTCVAIFKDLRDPEKLKQQSVQDSLSVFNSLSDRIFLLAAAAERGQQIAQRQIAGVENEECVNAGEEELS